MTYLRRIAQFFLTVVMLFWVTHKMLPMKRLTAFADKSRYSDVVTLLGDVLLVTSALEWLRVSGKRVSIPLLRKLSVNDPRKTAVPEWAEYLLFIIVDRKHAASIAGDLEEDYRVNILPRFGRRKANLWYWRQVIALVPPSVWAALRRLFGVAGLASILKRLLP